MAEAKNTYFTCSKILKWKSGKLTKQTTKKK